MTDPVPRPLVRSWPWFAAAVLFTVVLLATLGIAPTLWYKILPYLEPHLVLIALLGGGLGATGLFLKAWSVGPHKRGPALFMVAVGMMTIVLLLLTVFKNATPAGKLHVVEYAVLAYLVLNSLDVRRFGDRAFVVAVVGLLAIGVVDECVQYLLPNRYFDLMDIAGNWVATVLGVVFWMSCSAFSPWRQGADNP